MCLNVQDQGYSHCVMYVFIFIFYIFVCVTYFVKCIYMMLSSEQFTFLLLTGIPKYYEIKVSSSTSRNLAYLDAVGDVHQE